MTAAFLSHYEKAYPWIEWREPIRVSLPSGEGGFACRVCVAMHGLKGSEVAGLPADPEVVRAHLREKHLPVAA